MYYTCHYQSPLGGITMACDEEGLTGLWFDGQKYFGSGFLKEADPENREEKETVPGNEQKKPPVLAQAEKWLDLYFAGRRPDLLLRCILRAVISVWPYGNFCWRFPMDRQPLTKSLPAGFRNRTEEDSCQLRRQAARWDIIRCP